MDPRYATSPGRVRNRTGRIATLDKTLPEYPSAYQTSPLTAAGVPAAQINHVGGAPVHPQVRARAMVEQAHHPEAGTLRRNLLLGLGAAGDGGMLADVVEAALPPSRGHRVRVAGIAAVPDGLPGITLIA